LTSCGDQVAAIKYETTLNLKFVYRGIASMPRGYRGVLWPRR
jgi:hypothetical protein